MASIDEVGRDHVEPHHRRVADERHEGEAPGLAQQPLQQEVGPVELLGVSGARVADDDGRPVHRCGHAAVAGLGDLELGQELGLLVEVVERLAHVEVGLVEGPAVPPAHVAGADVLVAAQVGAALGEAQDVAGALEVDLHADVAGHAQVVDRRQVPDLGHVAGQSGAVVEPEPGDREVAGDQVDAPGEVGLGGLEGGDPFLGQRLELRLHEAGGAGPRRPAQDAGQQPAAEEAGEPGEQDRAGLVRSGAHPCCLGPVAALVE